MFLSETVEKESLLKVTSAEAVAENYDIAKLQINDSDSSLRSRRIQDSNQRGITDSYQFICFPDFLFCRKYEFNHIYLLISIGVCCCL